MKRVRVIFLVAVLLGLSGCLIYFVDQPASTISGTAIRITVSVDPSFDPFSEKETIPIVGIAVPDTWGVLSVTYLWGTGGGTSISGNGIFDQEASDSMNTEYPIEGYLWRCYRGPEVEYASDAYGHMYFVVDVPYGTPGTYTLRYSYGTLTDELSFVSVVDRKMVVDGAANYLDDWHNSSSQGEYANLFDVTFGNGTFVAVGSEGEILTSSDAVTWTKRTSGTSRDLNGIVFGDESFVAVGSSGEILTSPEGVTWTKQSSGTEKSLECVTYGNAIFVAAGQDGEILTSPDGITWTKRSSGTEEWLQGLAYGNRTFVAVGDWGQILTSPDGVTWTERSSGTDAELTEVTSGNDSFAAVGFSGEIASGEILTSPDGVTWTKQSLGTGKLLYGIAYVEGSFVVVGFGFDFVGLDPVDFGGEILSSRDGETWTQRSPGTSLLLSDIAYGNGTLVVVGAAIEYSNGIILRSTPPSNGGGSSGCFINTAISD